MNRGWPFMLVLLGALVGCGESSMPAPKTTVFPGPPSVPPTAPLVNDPDLPFKGLPKRPEPKAIGADNAEAESSALKSTTGAAEIAHSVSEPLVPDPEKGKPVEAGKEEKPPQAKASNGRAKIYDEQADGKQLVAAALERAKLEHKHVLLKFGGNWCGWCFKLHDLFQENELVRPIVHEEYELVLLDNDANRELMYGYGGKNKDYAYPHLIVLDMNGQVLTSQETGSLEVGPKHDPEKVAAFLKKWMPEKLDAEVQLTAALKQAGAEDKSVLMQVGSPYCGWCKQLSRFIQEHQPAFDQDYVHLKIDVMRMTKGKEVAERLQPGPDLGHPWMVILDPAGQTLSTSVGPGGNIGHPYEPEEVEHFLTMLQTTKKRLTDADLTKIRDDLNAFREARKKKSQ